MTHLRTRVQSMRERFMIWLECRLCCWYLLKSDERPRRYLVVFALREPRRAGWHVDTLHWTRKQAERAMEADQWLEAMMESVRSCYRATAHELYREAMKRVPYREVRA